MQIDWLTVAAQIVNFLVLVWLLQRFLYGPITRAMARRETRIEDRLADARAMQVAAIRHGNNFTRNFVYYYASALLLIAMGMTFMLFFLEIPERNASIINMAYGVIFTVGLYGSFTFFFGDTEKQKIQSGTIEKF